MSWEYKARAISHKINLLLGKRCRGVAPITFVLGFPKSGTTWACQLVADYTGKPFPRYNLFPTACPAVIHGHELPPAGLDDVVYVVRDGRDALVSLYNMYVHDYKPGQELSRYHARTLPGFQGPDKPVANMAGFIKAQVRLHDAAPCNWSDHVIRAQKILSDKQAVLRYEELIGEGAADHLATELGKLPDFDADPELAQRSLSRFAFKNQAKASMDMSKFLNKGQAGNWRNYFTRETAKVFADTMGAGLIAAGYEKDHGWVESVPETLDEPAAD